jgi:quinoprotein glucose dehydrogenase
MNGFALDGSDVWKLITFLRSLTIGKGAELAKGDPGRGARLFESSGCAGCHTVSAKGGLIGPDLSEIGARRSLAQLERSVRDPGAEVEPDYWSLRARTRSGVEVSGIRLNEDTDSFQLIDAGGRLESLWKAELASWEIVRASPMPSLAGKLGRAAVDDLVAYLAGLRGQPEKRAEGR